MASKTISKWNPYGVALNVTAATGTVTRTSATKFTVKLTTSWETYYDGAKTNYGMSATSGGVTKVISSFGTSRSNGSITFVGTYSISGNGSASKTIDVVFKNYNSDTGASSSKTISLSVSVPAWTSYTVAYNANGGTGAPTSQTKWKDQALTLSSTKPTRTGYTFKCWCPSVNETSVKYSPGGSYTTNASITLYAIWTANTYTVSYNANGGSGAPAQQTKTYGKTLVLSTTKPTRTGYDFKGWGTSSTDTSVDYASGANYTNNAAITLYAIWELKTYTVSYNSNGGTGAPGNQTKKYNTPLTLSTIIPTNSGYIFKGWSTSSDATTATYQAGSSYTSNANVTLYAVWEREYKKPRIYDVTVNRCDENGASVGDDADNTSGCISFNWYTFYNVTSAVVSWTSSSGTISGSKPADISGTGGTITHVIFGDNALPMDQTFTIDITITDGVDTVVYTTTLEGYLFPLDMLGGGNGIAFGKPAEKEGVAETAFKSLFTGGILQPTLKPDTNLDDVLLPNTYIGPAFLGEYDSSPFPGGGFTLEVDSAGEEGELRQRIQSCHKTESSCYERYYYDGRWGNWYEAGGFKSAITVGMSDDVFLNSVNVYTQIPFNVAVMGYGNGLTLSGNYVRVGAGVRNIRISGQTKVNCSDIAGNRHARLCKNSNGVVSYISWTTVKMDAYDQDVLIFTPIITNVSEGDLLYMVFYTPDEMDENYAGNSTNGYQTYMTVESI